MKFKRLTILTAMFAPLLGFAQATFTENGIVYTEDLSDPSKLAVIVVAKKSPMVMEGLSAYEGDITVPSKVAHDLDEYAVTGIGQGAFFGCDELESLIIEDGPTKILANTIVAKNLKKMVFPNTMKSIKGFFSIGLESVSLGNSLQTVENSTFGNVESLEFPNTLKTLEVVQTTSTDMDYKLKDLRLPSGMNSIKMSFSFFEGEKLDLGGCKVISDSFRRCKNLTDLNLGEGVQKIENSFENLDNIETLKIPNSCKTISESFTYTQLLQNLDLGEGIENIHDSFKKIGNIKELKLPKSLKTVTESFISLDLDEELNLPEGLKEIKDSFKYLKSVKKLTVPSSVKLIEESFSSMSDLEDLNIESPDLVIKGSAFLSGNLKSLTVNWVVPPTKPSFLTGGFKGVIYVPKGTVDAYIEAWKLTRGVESGWVQVLEK